MAPGTAQRQCGAWSRWRSHSPSQGSGRQSEKHSLPFSEGCWLPQLPQKVADCPSCPRSDLDNAPEVVFLPSPPPHGPSATQGLLPLSQLAAHRFLTQASLWGDSSHYHIVCQTDCMQLSFQWVPRTSSKS